MESTPMCGQLALRNTCSVEDWHAMNKQLSPQTGGFMPNDGIRKAQEAIEHGLRKKTSP